MLISITLNFTLNSSKQYSFTELSKTTLLKLRIIMGLYLSLYDCFCKCQIESLTFFILNNVPRELGFFKGLSNGMLKTAAKDKKTQLVYLLNIVMSLLYVSFQS